MAETIMRKERGWISYLCASILAVSSVLAVALCFHWYKVANTDNGFQFTDQDGVVYAVDADGYLDRSMEYYQTPHAGVKNCWTTSAPSNFGVCCPKGFGGGHVKFGYVCVPKDPQVKLTPNIVREMWPPETFRNAMADVQQVNEVVPSKAWEPYEEQNSFVDFTSDEGRCYYHGAGFCCCRRGEDDNYFWDCHQKQESRWLYASCD